MALSSSSQILIFYLQITYQRIVGSYQRWWHCHAPMHSVLQIDFDWIMLQSSGWELCILNKNSETTNKSLQCLNCILLRMTLECYDLIKLICCYTLMWAHLAKDGAPWLLMTNALPRKTVKWHGEALCPRFKTSLHVKYVNFRIPNGPVVQNGCEDVQVTPPRSGQGC